MTRCHGETVKENPKMESWINRTLRSKQPSTYRETIQVGRWSITVVIRNKSILGELVQFGSKSLNYSTTPLAAVRMGSQRRYRCELLDRDGEPMLISIANSNPGVCTHALITGKKERTREFACNKWKSCASFVTPCKVSFLRVAGIGNDDCSIAAMLPQNRLFARVSIPYHSQDRWLTVLSEIHGKNCFHQLSLRPPHQHDTYKNVQPFSAAGWLNLVGNPSFNCIRFDHEFRHS